MSKYVTRLRRKAQIRFALALIIFVLTTIFVVLPKYQQMVEAKEKIAVTDEEVLKNSSILELERDKYRDLKSEYSLRAAREKKTAITILPDETAETDLVRMLETEAVKLAGDDPASFSLESVGFGSSQKEQDADYSILPISIDIKGNDEKLMEFIRYLEKTGNSSVEDVAVATRLLEIESIDLQLPEDEEDEIQVGLSLNAFVMNDPQEK